MSDKSEEPVRIKLTETIDTVPIRVLGRSHLACVSCRTQKTKCDGAKPTCKACLNSSKKCFYESKDRKIILLESQLNKLQNRINYLETNLKQITLKSDIKVIDLSQEDDAHGQESFVKQEADSENDLDSLSLLPRRPDPEAHQLGSSSSEQPDFLSAQYPLFSNPLFADPDNFNQDYLHTQGNSNNNNNNNNDINTHDERPGFDKIIIETKPHDIAKSLEFSNKNILKFDYELQNVIGEFAYFDKVNTTVSNFHQNSKQYLSDSYFDYPFNGFITLPEKEYAVELFDIVYDKFHVHHYLYDKEEFLAQIDTLYENLNGHSSQFLCKLLITLAIGEQMVFSKLSYDPNFSVKYGDRLNSGIPGLKFFTLAIEFFRFNQEHLSPDYIQTCVLIGSYEQMLNRYTSAYAYHGLAMRLSMANGFHRKWDNSKDATDKVKKEKLKRIWWTVFNSMAHSCAKLHLPMDISYLQTDVELPLENFVDLGDGFRPEIMNAELSICKYLNEIVSSIYSVSSRTYDKSSSECESCSESIDRKVKKTLLMVGEFNKSKQQSISFFKKLDSLIASDALTTSTPEQSMGREEIDVVLWYHCAIIFTTRPVVLSFFRKLVPETTETRHVAQLAIESACEILKIMAYLKRVRLLQTFSYWDNQFCFASLLVLTVAGLAGFTSPASSTGVEIMAFMANSGNHSARAYLSKLITLEECLVSSGHKSIYNKPLASLRTYPFSAEGREAKEADELKAKMGNKPSSQDTQKKQNNTRKPNPTKKPRKNPVKKPSPVATKSSGYDNVTSSASASASASSFAQELSASSQSSLTTPAQSASSSSRTPQFSSQPQQPSHYNLTSSLPNSNFAGDAVFFDDLVSTIQGWENPFFIGHQSHQATPTTVSEFNSIAPISGPRSIPHTHTDDMPQLQLPSEQAQIPSASAFMTPPIPSSHGMFDPMAMNQRGQMSNQQQSPFQQQRQPDSQLSMHNLDLNTFPQFPGK